MIARFTHFVSCITLTGALLAVPAANASAQTQTRSDEIGRPPSKETEVTASKYYFAGVGIDEYQSPEIWKSLDNAVNDVERVRDVLVEDFDFETRDEWILTNEEATATAIRALLDDLRNELSEEGGNLIFFFAGHGAELRDMVGGEEVGRRGFLVPVEVKARVDASPSQYLEIETLLETLARLNAHHVLVILDSCYSGMALESTFKLRGEGESRPAQVLRRRVSRKVITSAGSDELAADGGADFPDNSLFTGWLVEGLQRAAAGGGPGNPSPDLDGDGMVTVTELYLFIHGRVRPDPSYPQNPDFGSFKLDQEGELVLTIERDAFDELYDEAVAAYEEDKLEQFYAAVQGALQERSEGPRVTFLRYLRALVDGEDGPALLALRELSAIADAGEEVPMSRGSLNNRLRQAERLCAKAGCDLEGG